jgi:hypothetical protein
MDGGNGENIMTPKEKLSREIVNLVTEFYEKTGVAIEDINIGWYETSEPKNISKQYTVTGIAIGMKP